MFNRRSMMRGILAAGALAIAASSLAVAPAATALPSADNGTWSIFPAQKKGNDPRAAFFFESNAGQAIKDNVIVRNSGKIPITFTLYPADAFNAAGGGGFALRQFGDTNTDVGSWVKLDKAQITVAPGKEAQVGFTMNVPRNASPGDHVGGIVSLNAAAEQVQGQDGVAIGVRRAVGTRIYTRVSGATTPSLAIQDVKVEPTQTTQIPFFGKGSATITYTLTNTGNTRQQPQSAITVDGLFGRTLAEFPAKGVPEVLPGQSITVTQQWDELPALDLVHVRVNAASDTATAGGDSTYWAIPWLLLIGLGVVLGLVFGARWLARRNRTRKDEEALRGATSPFPTSNSPMSGGSGKGRHGN